MQSAHPSNVGHAAGWHAAGWAVGRFLVLFAAVWLACYFLHRSLPFVKPGSDIVYEAKYQRLADTQMFGPGDRNRILVFGNSKLMASFRPDEFDAAIGPGTRSVNLALPGDGRFLPLLEAALAAGNVPTHVFLSVAWDAQASPPTLLDRLHDDSAIADRLMPFRRLARDVTTFAFLNRFDFARGYRDAESERERMLAQRGWYFIHSQSHYPGDRLPDDYRLPTDRADWTDLRAVPQRSLVRSRLEELARDHGFVVTLIPSYARVGEIAPPASADLERLAIVSRSPLIEIAGPDDWLYPAADFADPVHLNPSGARLYTQDLARLLKELDIIK
jgi:hypothetical protein